MIEQGLKITDHNKEDEGYEVNSSIFKVTNYLFKTSQPVCFYPFLTQNSTFLFLVAHMLIC